MGYVNINAIKSIWKSLYLELYNFYIWFNVIAQVPELIYLTISVNI